MQKLSDIDRCYAAEMAYASKQEGIAELKEAINSAPKMTSSQYSIAIGYITDYGKSLINMRAMDPKERYPSVQMPSKFSSTYPIYEACVKEILSARTKDPWELILEIQELREKIALQENRN